MELKINVPRIWNNEDGRVFTVLRVSSKANYAAWEYLDNKHTWEDRVVYILNNSVELSPVLKELYEC
jgi:hypothetical protein